MINFLLTRPLHQITFSTALCEVWTHYGEQTQEDDCEQLIKALELANKENIEEDRKKLLISLNNKDQVHTL